MFKKEINLVQVKNTLPKGTVEKLNDLEKECRNAGVESVKLKIKGIWVKVY